MYKTTFIFISALRIKGPYLNFWALSEDFLDVFKTTTPGGDSKSDSLHLKKRMNQTKKSSSAIHKKYYLQNELICTAFMTYLFSMFASSVSLPSEVNKIGDTFLSFLLQTSFMPSPTFLIGLDVFTGPGALNEQSNPVKKIKQLIDTTKPVSKQRSKRPLVRTKVFKIHFSVFLSLT